MRYSRWNIITVDLCRMMSWTLAFMVHLATASAFSTLPGLGEVYGSTARLCRPAAAPRCAPRLQTQLRQRAARAQAQADVPSDRRPVLVVGDGGAVCTRVVDALVSRAVPARVLVSPLDSQREGEQLQKRAPHLIETVQGDACDYTSLEAAMVGCRACVACAYQPRRTQPLDVLYKIWDPGLEFLGAWGPSKPADDDYDLEDMTWLDPASTSSHPFNWALLTACNIRDAAAATGCPHVLRLSEITVRDSAWDARIIARNAAFSMHVKWQAEADRILSQSVRHGVKFTVVRVPPLLVDGECPQGSHPYVDAVETGAGGWRGGSEIGLGDVAELLAICATERRGVDAVLSCGYAKDCDAAGAGGDWASVLASAGFMPAPPQSLVQDGQGGEEGSPDNESRASPMYTTAVLCVPAVMATAVLGLAVAGGWASFPPREGDLFRLATMNLYFSLALFSANVVRGAVMDRRPARPVLHWFKKESLD